MEKVEEYVVLVDKNNNVLGTSPKLETHNKNTPLHRGFSLFLFNSKGKILLQQRSSRKKTWPLVWSNSCCGHPMLNESNIDAVRRRLKFELGIKLEEIHEILPNFSYRAEKDGIVENEICPVLVGFTDQKPLMNRDEVENIRWVNWQNFINEIEKNPGNYSQWCGQEVRLLKTNEEFLRLYKKFTSQ